jgi:hypothetical protein
LLSDNHEFNNESIFKEILQLAQTDHWSFKKQEIL